MDERIGSPWRPLLGALGGFLASFLVLVIAGLVADRNGTTEDFLRSQSAYVLALAVAPVALLLVPWFGTRRDMVVFASIAVLTTVGFSHTDPPAWLFLPGLVALVLLLVVDLDVPARLTAVLLAVLEVASSVAPLGGTRFAVIGTVVLVVYPLAMVLRLDPDSKVRERALVVLCALAVIWAIVSVSTSIDAKDAGLLLGLAVAGPYALVTAALRWNPALHGIQWSRSVALPGVGRPTQQGPN